MPKYVAAYVRMSSFENAQGDSRPRQVEAVKALAKKKGWILKDEGIFVDVFSGTKDLEDRPAFNALIDFAYEKNRYDPL